MARLDSKVAIITGGATGVGRGITRAFASEGATVVIASRNRDSMERAAAEMRPLGAVETYQADVTDEAQVAALFDHVVQRFGRVDIAVNNAGIEAGAPLHELPLETWERVIAVNLTGVFLCCREAMRVMMPRGGGRIINIGSTAAQMPRPDASAYAASKFGVVGLTHSAAIEGRAHGIAVCCLHPGNVDIETRGPGRIHPEPMMEVSAVADAAVAMAAMPPHVNLYQAIILPLGMPYLGRG